MRRPALFIGYLALLSVLSGWLMSRMSWIGRIGVSLFHRDYQFLKVWYKGALLVFGGLVVLYLMQGLAQRRLSKGRNRVIQILALLAAIAGLWLSYSDFQDDLSHHLLRERFHVGVYLFWVGWMSISIACISGRRQHHS